MRTAQISLHYIVVLDHERFRSVGSVPARSCFHDLDFNISSLKFGFHCIFNANTIVAFSLLQILAASYSYFPSDVLSTIFSTVPPHQDRRKKASFLCHQIFSDASHSL